MMILVVVTEFRIMNWCWCCELALICHESTLVVLILLKYAIVTEAVQLLQKIC